MTSYDLKNLENKTKSYYKNHEKTLLDMYDVKTNEYVIGIVMNYIIDYKLYEVYCYVDYKSHIISGLNNKLIKNNMYAKFYFKYLQKCINKKGIKFFFKS